MGLEDYCTRLSKQQWRGEMHSRNDWGTTLEFGNRLEKVQGKVSPGKPCCSGERNFFSPCLTGKYSVTPLFLFGELNHTGLCGVKKLIRLFFCKFWNHQESFLEQTLIIRPVACCSYCFLTSSPHPRGAAQGSPTALHLVTARKCVSQEQSKIKSDFQGAVRDSCTQREIKDVVRVDAPNHQRMCDGGRGWGGF